MPHHEQQPHQEQQPEPEPTTPDLVLRVSGGRLVGLIVGVDVTLAVLVLTLVTAGLVLIGGLGAGDDLVVLFWSVGVSFLAFFLVTIVLLSLGIAAAVWGNTTTRLPVVVAGAQGLWARPRFRQSTTFWFPWTAIRSVRVSRQWGFRQWGFRQWGIRQWGIRPRLEIRTDDDVLAVPLDVVSAPTHWILAELTVRAAGRCPIGDGAQEQGSR